jgi:hypothetical protein
LGTLKVKLKPLWESSFTFSMSLILGEIEKVFAKNLGFLPDKENRLLNFG